MMLKALYGHHSALSDDDRKMASSLKALARLRMRRDSKELFLVEIQTYIINHSKTIFKIKYEYHKFPLNLFEGALPQMPICKSGHWISLLIFTRRSLQPVLELQCGLFENNPHFY